MKQLYYYLDYGLVFESEIYLPEFTPVAAQPPDVIIRTGELPVPANVINRGEISHKIMSDGLFWSWNAAGRYRIIEGKKVIVQPGPEAEPALVRQPLCGTVMAAILQQRGLLTLHGSAVEIDGKALIIVGDKGYGKSTLAAAMHRHGYRILTDDITAVDCASGRKPLIHAGVPCLKLWPDAAKAIGLDPAALQPVTDKIPKLLYHVPFTKPDITIPAGWILFLCAGNEIMFKQQSLLDAFQKLLISKYFAVIEEHWPTNILEMEFRQCATLANIIPVITFTRPREPELIDTGIKETLNHIRSIQQ